MNKNGAALKLATRRVANLGDRDESSKAYYVKAHVGNKIDSADMVLNRHKTTLRIPVAELKLDRFGVCGGVPSGRVCERKVGAYAAVPEEEVEADCKCGNVEGDGGAGGGWQMEGSEGGI